MEKSQKHKEEIMSDIWNTQKPSTASTAKRSIWGTQRSEPVRQANTQGANTLETHHVSKPLPVFSTIFADHVEFNKYMKQVILEHRQKNPETTASNVKAWHSSWMTHKENPKFQPLVDRVLSACTFVSAGYFQTQELEFSIFNFWAAMYDKKGEHTIRHSHFPSDFAACYYVDVEPGCSPIIFEKKIIDGVHDNNEPLTIQPQNGMLVLWPAILHHEVPPTETKRMVVAMNIDKYGRTDV